MIINLWFQEDKYLNINEIQKIKNRNYGIDLLRIFSMINIVNLHIILYSRQIYLDYSNPKFKHIWRLEAFSYPAVNCFGLISGIVGYKKYKFANIIYLWFQTLFYSVCISYYLFFIEKLKKNNLIISFFPILIKRSWYINAYFSMYILLPIINFGINSLKRTFYRNLIISVILLFSVYDIIGKIMGYSLNLFLNNGYSSMWLLLLYIIGSYIGKHIISYNNKCSYIYFISYILIFFFSTFFNSEFFSKLYELKNKLPKNIFISYISPTTIMQAISLIMIFSKIKIKNKLLIKIITFLKPLTFSTLLIHEQLFQSKINKIITLFNWIIKFKNKYLFYKIYGIGIIIYFICILIDYLRFLLFKLFKIMNFSLFLENVYPEIIDKIIILLN